MKTAVKCRPDLGYNSLDDGEVDYAVCALDLEEADGLRHPLTGTKLEPISLEVSQEPSSISHKWPPHPRPIGTPQVGMHATIIQHPRGRTKTVSLWVLKKVTEKTIEYRMKTEQGSSGSMVFDEKMDPIGLNQEADLLQVGTGIGARISSVVNHLRAEKRDQHGR